MDFVPDTFAEVLQVLGILGIALVVLDWRIKAHVTAKVDELRNEVKRDVEHRTQAIQPGYRNGGESLADVAHELRRIRTHLGLLEEEQNASDPR